MTTTHHSYLLGLDVGSTTAKAVLLEPGGGAVVASAYRRHEARIAEVVHAIVAEVTSGLDGEVAVLLTGSCAMGLAERTGLPFVQEVHAACTLTALRYPDARTLLDIGGEDSKLVYFDADGRLDARMNGGCAGGTGAFLDQMASLLSTSTGELEPLAAAGTEVHPVASRCGVFAKTDVQNLLSRGISRSDVAVSIFHALATQVLAALARGRTPGAPLLMTGGPLTFLPTLRRVFLEKLHLDAGAGIVPANGELACAEGAALAAGEQGARLVPVELSRRLAAAGTGGSEATGEPPLFGSDAEREEWLRHRFTPVPRVAPAEASGGLFLGIDSGSTTTKLALVDGEGRLLASSYRPNRGEPLEAVYGGVEELLRTLGDGGPHALRGAAATGYGEDLVRAALGIEHGLVETAAHLRAARALAPEVSFVLDIGGQDMKALFVRDGGVDRVEINEACSSGCGSFLETFARGMNVSVEEFAEAACRGRRPRALGSRCTVFMNSMVKQALREGAGLEDIAAGLAYSVARNCVQKVLKLRDFGQLGACIVVQGGTFLNPSVHRAFEVLTGQRVICADVAGLAGAYGAALWARDRAADGAAGPELPALEAMATPREAKKRDVRCRGCENQCPVTLVDFAGAGRFVSGNRCERAFRNRQGAADRGTNHLAAERDLLLQRPLVPAAGAAGGPRLRIGIPLALGMYEGLPFWTSLFAGLGHDVVLSGTATDTRMIEEASDTFTSDSVCLPARVANGHVVRLGQLGVDRLFFPQVFSEPVQAGARKGTNCPIVTGFPEAVASAVPPERRGGVPMAIPPVSFRDEASLRRTARRALADAGIAADGFDAAFAGAVAELRRFHEARRELGRRALAGARERGRRLVVLACRPYHLDPYLHHGVPEMLADLGYDVVSSQCLPDPPGLDDALVLPQWSYPNAVLQAARWVAARPEAQLVQLNSFGCGPDAVIADEAGGELESKGRAHTLLRIDESTAPGSLRLRLRSMELGEEAAARRGGHERRTTPAFRQEDRRRTLLAPQIEPILFTAAAREFRRFGYTVEVLPPPDRESLELGLAYVNNEICYPAILTIGDVVRALRSGRYRAEEVAVMWLQTGGQCRASNYVPLLKKALATSGHADVPVVALQYGEPLNEQPGFALPKLRLVHLGVATIAVTDALSMMARALAPREKRRGEARATALRLAGEWSELSRHDLRSALAFVERAVGAMAAIPAEPRVLPRVGIVGEIYVKYSAYANRHLEDWLVEQGCEPVVPPFTSFFVQEPLNAVVNREAGLDGRRLVPLVSGLVDAGLSRFLAALNRRLERFPYPVHFPVPRELAAKARDVLSLTHQYGEGWLLGGEILDMADRGVESVVCLQPFGCIANQVVARGVERRIRALRPDLNLLFLDLDHNTSEANLFNRMKLLVTPPPRLGRRPAPAA